MFRPRTRALAVAGVAALLFGLAPTVMAAPRATVYVLDEEASLPSAGAPAGLDPAVIETMLDAHGFDATRVPGANVPVSARVIVNPYGASFPATEVVEQALAAGAGWVNLGGVPFSRPDGVADAASAERHGVRAGAVPALLLTGTAPTELGSSLAPAWSATGDRSGVALHALLPRDERPLVNWVDDAFGVDGITAGPAVVLITAPTRIVAAGHAGDASPLSATAAGASARLADLVRVAMPTEHVIDGASVVREGSSMTVRATARRGRLEGVGTFAVPAPWTPENPVQHHATVRLWRGRQLVDQVSLASNAAVAGTAGDTMTLNGEPYVLEGMASGQSTPPELDDRARAAMLRHDLLRMHEVGVTAYRLYGSATDWLWNASADAGMLLVPAVGLGWVFGDSESAAQTRRPQARDLARDALGRHNLLMISLGNELMDPDHDRARRAIELLAQEVRNTNPHALVTYGASHDEPWLMGPMPFLDVYTVNCYGASYPYGYPEPGFAHCIAHAKQLAAVGQPLALGEWGANTWQVDGVNMYLRDQADLFVQELEVARAEFVREKWFTMMQLGAVGGFAFQWADGTNKCLFTSAHCQVTDPLVLPGDTSDYRIMNHEKYWGFHDVWRTPRLALQALEDIYLRGNTSPVGRDYADGRS